jgi:hypothetical protein
LSPARRLALLAAPLALLAACVTGARTAGTPLSATAAADVAPTPPAAAPPRLLVLVSVDQCRADYLERLLPALPPDGGLRRLLDGGASWPRAAHTHTVTSTGPGHAAIATGCLPARAGIPENEWIDGERRARVYCVDDPAGGVSATHLERPALGDVLQERLGEQATVASVSFKDRTALLLGGRRADAAAWFDMTTARWTGRTAGRPATPAWAEACNGGPDGPGPLAPIADRVWQPTVPEALAARVAGPDDAPGEDRDGRLGRTFPHRQPGAEDPADARAFHAAVSPWCDELTLQLALAALDAEDLGQGGPPDLLCVGLSGMDNVGHAFGPDSREVLEAFLAVDRVLARLMEALDARVGPGAWTLGLTSDHGIAPVPEQSGGRRLVRGPLERDLEAALVARLGEPPRAEAGTPARWLLGIAKPSVHLDHASLERAGLAPGAVAEELARVLAARPGVAGAYTRAALASADARAAPEVAALARDVHPTRSGDVLFLLAEGTVFTGSVATDHGSHHGYDRDVPVLLYGAGVVRGRRPEAAAPIDLAPTLARIAGLGALPDADGRVLEEALAAAPGRRAPPAAGPETRP